MTVSNTDPERISKQLKIIFDGLDDINVEQRQEEITSAKENLQNIIDELREYEEKEQEALEKSSEVKVQFHRNHKKEHYEVKKKFFPKFEMDQKLKEKLAYFIPLILVAGGIVLLYFLIRHFI